MIKQELIDAHEQMLDDYDLHKGTSTTYSRAYEYICSLEKFCAVTEKIVTRVEITYPNRN